MYTLCKMSPFQPTAICVNNKQHIIVGLQTSYGVPPIKLLVYSADASVVLQEIVMDKSGRALFQKWIYQVKQKGNGDYVVADQDRIVCINEDNTVEWIYQAKTSFVQAVVCDKSDNIIIAKYYSDTINILGSNRGLVKTLLTQNDGINCPCSLSIDRHGHLWVGQLNNIKVFKCLT